jgi:hypothetical protein
VAGHSKSLHWMASVSNTSSYKVLAWSSLFALFAWLLVALPTDSIFDWLPPERYEFALPRVSVPYTPGADVVSAVPDLFSALTLAVTCVLLAEIAKGLTWSCNAWKGPIHLSFVLYQCTLLLDVLRKYSWDWYGYLLYYARIIELSHERPRPEVLPLPAPWLSFLALLLCVLLSALASRNRSADSGDGAHGGRD